MSTFNDLTAKVLKEIATEQKIDFDASAKKADMVKLLEATDLVADDFIENDDSKSSDSYYYHLKTATYIDDDANESTKLVPAGLYCFDAPLARFEKNPVPRYVIGYDGVPNESDIVTLATELGVDVPKGKTIDFDELLENITSEVVFIEF